MRLVTRGIVAAAALVLAVGCNRSSLGGGDNPDGGGDDMPSPLLFDIQPGGLQTVNVGFGQTSQNITFTATYDGQPVDVAWTVDRGEIATAAVGPSSSTTVTIKGATAGIVAVSATYNGQTVTRQILVRVSGTQNGVNTSIPSQNSQVPKNVGDLSAGGGVGGVGGEGLGGAVTDQATINALMNPTGDVAGQALKLLYPYDKTVWPRGMLAPLLMWSWTPGDADAIRIDIATSSGSFTWSGTFGRPAILAMTGGKFIRHPIPQDVWDAATNTAGALTQDGTPDKLTVKVTLSKGNVGYGPLPLSFSVAPARLTGTVYYNSYGTQYVKNWVNTDKSGNVVGAAILSVRSGDTAPKLVIGKDSPLGTNGVPTNDDGCRVCHVVAARGRWIITQSELGAPGDGRSFLYDLQASNVQASVAQIPQEGVFGWAAMIADGTRALTNMINPSSSNPAINQSKSNMWQFGANPSNMTTPVGLPAGVAAGYPSYSPDDQYITYIDATGATGDVKGPIKVASYDANSQAFSNVITLGTPPAGERYGFPAFLPDNSAVVFEDQVRTSQSDSVLVTRNGARSRIAIVNRNGTPTVTLLNQLNGVGYVPKGGNNHGSGGNVSDPKSSYDETGKDDTTLNYEPTVLPINVGGYAWVVFTSRRLYGNQLTAVPYQSWPPDYNTRDLNQATVKKIWVAAVDLNAPAGSDPSHPAFYLPAQEILAGNSRGLWVLDPCLQNGSSCSTGDQCCNGFCEPSGSGGALMCSSGTGQCSKVQEKCTTASDCCDNTNQCINGFCAAHIIG